MGPGCGPPLSGPRQPKHPLSWLRLLHTSTRSLHQQSQRQTRLREGCRLTQHRMETQSEPSQLPSPAHSTFTPLRGPNIELRGSRFLPRRLSGDPLHSPLCSGSLSENGISWRHCTQPEGCAGLSQPTSAENTEAELIFQAHSTEDEPRFRKLARLSQHYSGPLACLTT